MEKEIRKRKLEKSDSIPTDEIIHGTNDPANEPTGKNKYYFYRFLRFYNLNSAFWWEFSIDFFSKHFLDIYF